MSGVEAVAVIGTIGAIIEITKTLAEIYQAIKDKRDLPKAFEEVNKKLPLLENILKLAKDDVESASVNPDEAIQSTLQRCQDRATNLKKIFEDIRDTSKHKPIKKWYRSIVLRLGKGNRFEELMENILVDVQSLSNHQVFKVTTRTQVQELQAAIEELSLVEPSIPDDLFRTQAPGNVNFYGDGPMHTGPGDINYATRHGVIYKDSNVTNNFLGNQHKTKNSQRHTFEEKVNACRKALRQTDPENDRESLISAKGNRVENTCEWILTNDIFKSWLTGDTQLLWISGGPGKGKTMLSIFLTEDGVIKQNTKDVELVFFFLSHQDEKHNTATAVLRSLLYQIIGKRQMLCKHLLPHFENPEGLQETLSNVETLWGIFVNVIRDVDLGRMFCVLDGLDECDEDTMRTLIPKLVDMFSSKNPKPATKTFKMAIVSRDVVSLHDCARVRLDPDNDEQVAGDIERFISARVSELSRIDGFNDEIGAVVQKALLERSEGTFLWIGFVVNELRQKKTCTEVLETLEQLPRGLPAIYSRMLLQIDNNHRPMSSKILTWVTMAFRPLKLLELAVAINVTPSSPFIDLERAIRDEITLCESFLRVHEDTISLIHQSAADYLLREEPDNDPRLERFRVRPEAAHLELTEACFNYFAKSTRDNNGLFSKVSPLLHYAALQWPEHAKCCSIDAGKKLWSFLRSFFEEGSDLQRHWWKHYHNNWPQPQDPEIPPPIHVACYIGIAPCAVAMISQQRRMLRLQEIVHKKDMFGTPPLHRAVSRGNVEIIRVLLEARADVNMFGGQKMLTALYLAAENGNVAIMQVLIDGGAKINMKIWSGETALHAAAYNGREAALRLLIEKGGDINAKDKFGFTVLHSAAEGGNEAVVQMLLDLRADIRVESANGTTVLDSAVSSGNEAVVRLFMHQGLDVNLESSDGSDESGREKLLRAVRDGNEGFVRVLLDLGMETNGRDGFGRTLLMEAAKKGNEAIVRLLVNGGADLDATDIWGYTVLHQAVEKGDDAMVRKLFDLGAKANGKNIYGETALMKAVWCRNEAMVRLLVESGADVNATDRYGDTEMSRAHGNDAMVRLLELLKDKKA